MRNLVRFSLMYMYCRLARYQLDCDIHTEETSFTLSHSQWNFQPLLRSFYQPRHAQRHIMIIWGSSFGLLPLALISTSCDDVLFL
jgi:hypothetical protein